MTTQTWQGIADLPAAQDALLGTTLDHADRSPFYRARWGRRPPTDRAGLAGLPLTSKRDLRQAYPFGLLAVDRERLATYHESSGTGGVPTASYYTERDWDDLGERFARKWVPIGPSDMFLVRTPYALMMTGHMAHFAARSRGATVVPGDNRSLAMPYSRVVRVLHDLGVSLSWSLPTETMFWAAAARLAGHEPGRDFGSLRALYVAGEPLSPARRGRIGEIWGVPAIEDYGSTETGPLAGQCPAGALHLWADRVLFEVYDPRTRRCSPVGRGQLVVTMLTREAMPLLRYNLEDEVEIADRPCACGWRLPTVTVHGRSTSSWRVGDVDITQSGLEDIVFSLPVEYGIMFWRTRARPDRLVVEFEVDPGRRRVAVDHLEAALTAGYGIPVSVTGVRPGCLVPAAVLTGAAEVVKPRSLFGPDEDWDHALLYY